jgi:hypothetical protein
MAKRKTLRNISQMRRFNNFPILFLHSEFQPVQVSTRKNADAIVKSNDSKEVICFSAFLPVINFGFCHKRTSNEYQISYIA